jgi:hypothetical protein
MMTSEKLIFESPDGGKTVYARKMGETDRHLHWVDPVHKKEGELSARWFKLKEAVFMADSDPTLNDAISKVEMLYAIKFYTDIVCRQIKIKSSIW